MRTRLTGTLASGLLALALAAAAGCASHDEARASSPRTTSVPIVTPLLEVRGLAVDGDLRRACGLPYGVPADAVSVAFRPAVAVESPPRTILDAIGACLGPGGAISHTRVVVTADDATGLALERALVARGVLPGQVDVRTRAAPSALATDERPVTLEYLH